MNNILKKSELKLQVLKKKEKGGLEILNSLGFLTIFSKKVKVLGVFDQSG